MSTVQNPLLMSQMFKAVMGDENALNELSQVPPQDVVPEEVWQAQYTEGTPDTGWTPLLGTGPGLAPPGAPDNPGLSNPDMSVSPSLPTFTPGLPGDARSGGPAPLTAPSAPGAPPKLPTQLRDDRLPSTLTKPKPGAKGTTGTGPATGPAMGGPQGPGMTGGPQAGPQQAGLDQWLQSLAGLEAPQGAPWPNLSISSVAPRLGGRVAPEFATTMMQMMQQLESHKADTPSLGSLIGGF